jgi:hypothetical protein
MKNIPLFFRPKMCEALKKDGERCENRWRVESNGAKLCVKHYHVREVNLINGSKHFGTPLPPRNPPPQVEPVLKRRAGEASTSFYNNPKVGICDICFSEAELYSCSSKSHRFCDDCLSACYRVRLEESKPSWSCSLCTDPRSVVRVCSLPPDFLRKYAEEIRRCEILSRLAQPGFTACPRCSMFGCVASERNVTCLMCGWKWCKECCLEAHENACGVIANVSQVHKIVEYHLNHIGAKKCPTCKRMIAREEGCNKVSCACGEIFCWVCGEKLPKAVIGDDGTLLVDPYDHFRNGRCAMYFTNVNERLLLFRKLLWENPLFASELKDVFPSMNDDTIEFYIDDKKKCEEYNASRTLKRIPRFYQDVSVHLLVRSIECSVMFVNNDIFIKAPFVIQGQVFFFERKMEDITRTPKEEAIEYIRVTKEQLVTDVERVFSFFS